MNRVRLCKAIEKFFQGRHWTFFVLDGPGEAFEACTASADVVAGRSTGELLG